MRIVAIASILGKLPTVEEYMQYAGQIDSMSADIYKYLNFDKMPDFIASAERGKSVGVEMNF